MQIIECGQAMDMHVAVEWDSGAYRITIYLRYFGFMNYIRIHSMEMVSRSVHPSG